jgi:MoxR-like ATPase
MGPAKTTKAEVTVNKQAFPTSDELAEVLLGHAYVTDRALATVLSLTLKLRKPLLLEGEAGVGKTQVAKTLAEVLQTP